MRAYLLLLLTLFIYQNAKTQNVDSLLHIYESTATKNKAKLAITIGDSYISKNLDSSLYYFEKGIEISELQNEFEQLFNNHLGLSELMFKTGNKKLAFYHAKKAEEYNNNVEYDLNDVLYRYENHVLPAYDNYIEPVKGFADLIIPNNKQCKRALRVITSHLKSKI